MVVVIGWAGIVCGAILFVAGLVDLLMSWRSTANVRTAADKAALVGETVNGSTETLEKHAGIDFKGQWEALAALATAVKDLDRSSRLFFLALAFFAVSGATIGIGEIAEGIAAQ